MSPLSPPPPPSPLSPPSLSNSLTYVHPPRTKTNTLRVANLRRHLAGAVPPADQILLLGPPFRVPRDSALRSEEVLASLRMGDEEDNPCSARGMERRRRRTRSRRSRQGQKGSGKGNGNGKDSGAAAAAADLAEAEEGTSPAPERSAARRLFLFSKRFLAEVSPEIPPCRLEPMDLVLPTEPDPSPVAFPLRGGGGGAGGTSSSSPQEAASPLHQALEVYERRFMLNLCRGRALADGADVRLAAMRGCSAEVAVLTMALTAAVSNLSDHRNGAARTRAEFAAAFLATEAGHAALLRRFEANLASLASVPLRPSLVGTARASGRVMDTLLDTVPVDRERAWAARCQTSHQRLSALFAELEGEFGRLGTAADWEGTAAEDQAAEDDADARSDEIETRAVEIRDRQARRLDRLTADHGEVVRIVMRAISPEAEAGTTVGAGTAGGDTQGAFAALEKMSKASADVLPLMEADDVALREMMEGVAKGKTEAMRRTQRRLREVSGSQSCIQRVLSSVGVLREALAQQTEDMSHLEHVAELPAAYRDFLAEIRRRRAYGLAISSTSEAIIQRLATMRDDEVKAREKFLRTSGRHLMPAFFEVFVATLATPPPLFTPQLPSLVEMDTLPDVGSDTCDAQRASGSSENDMPITKQISAEDKGISSASTLTDSQPHSRSSGGGGADAADHEGQSLIVSADENSNDIIMETGNHDDAAAAAERKTLQYENAALRQAIERMGGKTPNSYIEEVQQQQGSSTVDTSLDREKEFATMKAELENLRKELHDERAQAEAAKKAVVAKEAEDVVAAVGGMKLCDKISHSSFAVGDVGLFMPTGRGSGGKRTYLAFHTNCPHRYLSTDNVEGNPDYVLGRIVYQEELNAGEANTDSNPYGLHPGTKFWVLTVEVLRVPGR